MQTERDYEAEVKTITMLHDEGLITDKEMANKLKALYEAYKKEA